MRNTRDSPAYAENGPGIVNRSMPMTRNPRAASCQLAMLPTEPTPTTTTSASATVTAYPRSSRREPDARVASPLKLLPAAQFRRAEMPWHDQLREGGEVAGAIG